MQRDNNVWIDALRGDLGPEEQLVAHQDLGKILHRFVYNHLLKRQQNILLLKYLDDSELEELARDFVQDSLEQLSRNDFAELKKYLGEGKFTSWAITLAVNVAKQELRKSYWKKSLRNKVVLDPSDSSDGDIRTIEAGTDPHPTPETQSLMARVEAALWDCINALSDRRRIAFISRFHDEGQSAAEVARIFSEETSADAVNMLVYQAKRDLRKCLSSKGWNWQNVQEILPRN